LQQKNQACQKADIEFFNSCHKLNSKTFLKQRKVKLHQTPTNNCLTVTLHFVINDQSQAPENIKQM
jgi:hypothetical protein